MMLRQAKLVFFYSLILLCCLLVGCSKPSKTIQMGYNPWIGDQPIVIAQEKGFFKDEGVDVKVHYFTALSDVMTNFAENKIDVMLSTLNEALLLVDKGEKLKIISLVDYSNGADAIIAKKSIRSIRDLKGKKIGVEIGSISHFTVLKALKQANISSNDVTLVNLSVQEGMQEFKKGSLDALASWSPYMDQAIQEGGHVIFSSRDIPGEIIDVIVIRQSLLDEDPEACYKIISAYLKTLAWFDKNINEGLEIISKSIKTITIAELKEQLKGVKLTGLSDNLVAFGTPQAKGTIYSATQSFADFLLEQKLIANPINTEEIIYPNFIWEYQKQYAINSQ
ncbi:MAG: aliphatic sulfonate ABC transporter substrate-binding protein [Gammaproteobacteria bacterium]|nr:MAG: aliphatic sulfonate ABC transporter substrate-binding protein [Gammaproteobacteria bacterium]